MQFNFFKNIELLENLKREVCIFVFFQVRFNEIFMLFLKDFL